MPGGQHLDRGDAGNDVVAEFDVPGHFLQDSQGAVIQRRVTPGQEGAHAVFGKFSLNRLGPQAGSGSMPVGNRAGVITVSSPRRVR